MREFVKRKKTVHIMHFFRWEISTYSSIRYIKNPRRVVTGLKATTQNPSVSAEAKSRAKEQLAQMGVHVDIPASTQVGKVSRSPKGHQPGDEWQMLRYNLETDG